MTNPTSDPDLPRVFEQTQRQILRRLGDRWRVGDRLPPIRELATELGVGKVSAFRAVRELARQGVLTARRGRGTFVRRLPDPDRAAAAGPAPLLGRSVVILRGATDFFLQAAVDPIVDALSAQGCRVSCANCASEPGSDHHLSKLCSDAHGLVLVNPESRHPISAAPHQALAVISTSPHVNVAPAVRYDLLTPDNERGAALAGGWLRRVGCGSVCFLGVFPRQIGREMDPTSIVRLRGFEAGWGEPVPDEWQLMCNTYQVNHGARALDVYLHLSPRPRGVFAASDDLAIGFVQAALSRGLKPGVDFMLVGFDGQQRGRELACGPLTTVAVPMKRLGESAAMLLAQRIAEPDLPSRRMTLECELAQGATAPAATLTHFSAGGAAQPRSR